jgi:hypothetical protein
VTTETDRYFESYAEFSKVLRAWLIAYGIGAPVLFTTNDRLAGAISHSGLVRVIALCFLVGVVAQVLIASLNKSIMWALYYGSSNDPFKATRRYKLAYRLSENLSIDVAADVASIVMFAIATWIAFGVIFG